MLYSKLLGKTTKQTPKDEESLNAQLLIKAGFIQKEMAGVYVFLPLGKIVLEKIIQVIREEMNAIDGQEVLMSGLQNPELWKKTDRWSNEVVDIWFKTALQNGKELGLSFTHEEPLTKMLTTYVNSYKDLPFYVYQFQTKFRNELRARSGLLRTREFIMKDLYSFNKTEEDFEKYYERAKQAYIKIFDRLGIGGETFVTFASGGVFSEFSHEFQTVCENGEDTIYLSREKNIAVNKEVYTDEVLAKLDLTKEELEEVRATEVGNIFPLGTKFSSALELNYTDENGDQKPVIMGSYGIGPARTMATIVELSNDENGIIWPEAVAPFKVHLIGLNLEEETVKKQAFEVYEALKEAGIEVMFDEREETRAGQKFGDADLIGLPYRAVVSKKTEGKIEFKKRTDKESTNLKLDELISKLK